MKTSLTFLAAILSASWLMAADADPKEALLSASKKLADKPNYSWKTTVEVPGDPDGTIDGKAEKGGATVLTLTRGDVSFESVLKGNKGALKGSEGWASFTDVAAQEGGQAGVEKFVVRLLQNYKTPPAEVADLAGKVKDLKVVDGVYSGSFTEATAKDLLLYRTGSGSGGPEVSGAKGSIKFWLKDGTPSKYVYNLQGTISYNGNEREVTRTHTTEVKDVGTTKVTVPEEAAKKL